MKYIKYITSFVVLVAIVFFTLKYYNMRTIIKKQDGRLKELNFFNEAYSDSLSWLKIDLWHSELANRQAQAVSKHLSEENLQLREELFKLKSPLN